MITSLLLDMYVRHYEVRGLEEKGFVNIYQRNTPLNEAVEESQNYEAQT